MTSVGPIAIEVARNQFASIADEMGMDRVHEICTAYAAENPGFEIPPSIAAKKMPEFYRNISVETDSEIAVVTICRPEVMNALNGQTLEELEREARACAAAAAAAVRSPITSSVTLSRIRFGLSSELRLLITKL